MMNTLAKGKHSSRLDKCNPITLNLFLQSEFTFLRYEETKRILNSLIYWKGYVKNKLVLIRVLLVPVLRKPN